MCQKPQKKNKHRHGYGPVGRGRIDSDGGRIGPRSEPGHEHRDRALYGGVALVANHDQPVIAGDHLYGEAGVRARQGNRERRGRRKSFAVQLVRETERSGLNDGPGLCAYPRQRRTSSATNMADLMKLLVMGLLSADRLGNLRVWRAAAPLRILEV